MIFGKQKTGKVKEPKAARKARKKQEDNQKKLKKEYAESVDKSRQRSYEIQSPDVKARMKQNQKDIEMRDKAKRKKHKEDPVGAAKKYK
jgi:hypothetical protein